jgi:hypothetical protein
MDEILGGQYLGTAKPFNVLNPSGISGEQSLATITAVGEGNRNRAAQSAAQQRQIAAAQEAQNKEMEHNALEAEKDRQLQQKRWKDEQWFRDRSERLAMLYQDHETEMERLRDTEMLDLSQAQDEQISQYLTKRSEIEARKSEVGRRIQGLELLNKMREGIFSKDFRNEKGSMGAQMLEGLLSLSAGRVQTLSSASDLVNQAYENLFTQRGTQTPNAPGEAVPESEKESGVKGAGESSPGAKTGGHFFRNVGRATSAFLNSEMDPTAAYRAWNAGEDAKDSKTPKPQTNTEGEKEKKGPALRRPRAPGEKSPGGTPGKGAWVEDPKDPSSWVWSDSDQAKTGVSPQGQVQGPAPSGWYGELAEALARGAAGQAGSASEVAAGLTAMFSSLQQAVNADPATKRGYLDHARTEYETLRAKGADMYTLDRLLKGLWQKAGGNQRAAQAAEGQASMQGQKEGVPPSNRDATAIRGATGPNQELGRMLQMLAVQTDSKDPRKNLLTHWDDQSFLDLGTKIPTYEVEQMVMGAVTGLMGVGDPLQALTLLQDSDPENDPGGFEFLKTLDPEARKVILGKVAPALGRLQEVRKTQGIPDDLQVEDLKRLREEEAALPTELESSVLLGRAERSKKNEKIRGQGSKARTEARERFQKERDRIQKERP